MINTECKLKEACGVFGFYNNDDFNTAEMIYYGIFSLQHRGQEGSGIAVNDAGKIFYHKETGLVSEVFNDLIISQLNGKMGIGHVSYFRSDERLRENVQPLVLKYTKGSMAIAHNGSILNADKLRSELEDLGFIFQTSSDSEIIAALLSRERVRSGTLENALLKVMGIISGAYSLVMLSSSKLIAARDPLGMRPLVLGKKGDSYVVSSETAALNAVGAEFVRDVEPGEIIVINSDGIRSLKYEPDKPLKSALCAFEFIYVARIESDIEGLNVYQARFEAGKRLARENKIEADLVIGVPDSGIPSALGYSEESGIPFAEGLLKNRYVGRTFIKPNQGLREQGVAMKLTANKYRIDGKRLIVLDDSIVRGTTTKKLVEMLKKAGAKEVHMLVSSPPIKFPCYYGIDIKEKSNLIASTKSLEEIRQTIEADSLHFLSIEGLNETTAGANCGFCTACVDGAYPIN